MFIFFHLLFGLTDFLDFMINSHLENNFSGSSKYIQKLQWYLLASNWGQIHCSHFSPYEIGAGDTFLYHMQKCAV